MFRTFFNLAYGYFFQLLPKQTENFQQKRRQGQKGATPKVAIPYFRGYCFQHALLEAECLRAINTAGLDAHVGFLHEMNPSKNSLAYDLQESFRFLVDMAVISFIESKKMDNKDFIRTESYSLRLKPSGAKKVTEEFITG
ncbi:CRISPR-associated endonuclease Cas1 [Methanosarcina sp. WWM596]|uniref:CRISPR-associated endonuclease Cas1 n=1 Tax=Methanosarcina sp. WWM596 TaxID=1434103 RepID=UPI00064F5920